MSDDKSALSGVAMDVTLPQLRATPPCLPDGQAAEEFAYAAGDQVGERYRIVRRLGEGGMGEVYEAEDLVLRERVALKTLRPALTHDELAILRFQREIQLARKVTHRNVCRLFDVGLDRPKGRDAAYITMELLEGETLSARLHRAGRMSTAEALPIAEQLSAALVAAHSAGVIHRDLKCSNVILVEAPPRAVVTDMGMARAATTDGDQVTGDAVVGTPAYMAPEQVEGGSRITAACDIYALGVVLFEMVTGVLPFVAETPLATAVMRLRVPPPSPRSIVPDLDPRWELAILSCLARDPDARPRDADSVSRLLRPASAKTVGRRIVLVAAAATVLALALFAGWLWRNVAREGWVHQTAIPEIERLLADDDYASAAALAREALVVSPGNAALENLWTQATLEVSIDSTPPGADVLYRPYRSAADSWIHLGKTPLSGARIPRGFYVWQVANSGFLPAWRIAPSWLLYSRRPVKLTFHLVPERSAPPGMVGRAATDATVEVVSKLVFDIDSELPLDDFFIDRHEVTNAEFKRFVDAGGYLRPELWKQPFVRDGQPVSWDQAMAAFRDTTGRPGPFDLGSGHVPGRP